MALLSKNGLVLLVCNLIGYWVGHFLPPGIWAIGVAVLVSYHLFLAWRVITAEHEVGFSLPIFSTIVTHLACVSLVVTLAFGRGVIPFFWLVRYLIPALAPFERDWLFKAQKKRKIEETPFATPSATSTTSTSVPAVPTASSLATADDYEAWSYHLAHRNPLSRKPGTSIKDEYEQFMAARVKARPAIPPGDSPAETHLASSPEPALGSTVPIPDSLPS
jgi:hypothetical protein